jgi:asparagine synthase (glutamine-hydrolysing)
MCGIAGFLDSRGFGAAAAPEVVGRMCDALTHRGPDDSGIWIDEDAGVALGHRRLSILDLSPAGHQPMASACGRYVLSFNGEIYNHLDMRSELERAGCVATWRGHSDTETLLAAIRQWGLDRTLERCVGMYAFAVWDRQRRVLSLARDRLGEKPLYYGSIGSAFVFGSELSALCAYPSFSAQIDLEALLLFMRHNYVPAPHSIYEGISKLEAGSVLSVDADGRSQPSRRYWSCRAAALEGLASPYIGGERAAADELERLLKQSIAGQMIADVPVGAFLSGGIDSSTIVALMQSQSSRPVRTFSIGFGESGFNEAIHAAAVAKHLRTDHTELYVSPSQAQEVIPRLSALYDEPFADSSQIPTALMMALARDHVTVALSGDGGDELFGGYNRYFWAVQTWRRFGRAPKSLREGLASAITALSPAVWDGLFRRGAVLLPRSLRYNSPGEKLHKLASVLRSPHPVTVYRELVSQWSPPGAIVRGASEPLTVVTDAREWLDGVSLANQMMFVDQVSYLPDDILVKVDRAAMAVSLETRVPLLDHRVVEFAWRVPLDMKIKESQGKWLLRQVLDRHVPRQLVERPKMGFGVPIDTWLRGPLREWAEDLLAESSLAESGYLDPQPIRKRWSEHLSRRASWHYSLWCILMFQSWLRAGRRAAPAASAAARRSVVVAGPLPVAAV